jgi:hypothetical protein
MDTTMLTLTDVKETQCYMPSPILTPVSLGKQEAEIRRIEAEGQPELIVRETLS